MIENPTSSILSEREVPAAREQETRAQEIARLRRENEALKRRLQEVMSGGVSDRNAQRAALNLLEDSVAARDVAERENAERQRAERELAAELAATSLLHLLSSRLIGEVGSETFHEQIVETAMTLMSSDCASLQLLDPRANVLRLLASKGFHPDSERFWQTVSLDAGSASGLALKVGERVVMPDVEDHEAVVGAETMEEFRRCGIRAVLSTPLVSRRGEVLGMLSTHWRERHEAGARELRFLDLLTRQAADLLERHRQTEALRESEEKYRTLFDSMDEGYCILQLICDESGKAVDFRFLATNPAFEKHSGLAGAWDKTILGMVPGMEPKWFEIYQRVAVTGESARFEESSEALRRVFDCFAFRVGEPDERKVAVLFNDITERKKTEQALHEADERKDEFLAMLAHELRNPLAAIQSAVQLLRRDDTDTRIRHKAAEILHRQTRLMVRQVDDLLDVSRISTGKVELRKEAADIAKVVSHAVESIRPLCDSRNHELVVTLPSEPLHVYGDPARLTQVVGNLLTNACKFTGHGGRISLTVERKGDQAEIRVCDNGMGIAPAELSRIFEIFAQVPHSLESTCGGLGLGLTLVKRLVELHGGTVEASSAGLGQGSEFVVRLPLQSAPLVPAPCESPGSGGTAAKFQRILVVDDNRDVASSLEMVLDLMGYTVESLNDPFAAVEKAAAFHADVILLDIGMPGLNGFEVAKKIRALGQEGLKLVALTGWGQESHRRDAMEAGFDAHLVKPVDMDALESLLEGLAGG